MTAPIRGNELPHGVTMGFSKVSVVYLLKNDFSLICFETTPAALPTL